MERMNSMQETQGPTPSDRPAIFGLRYLEEEAAEVHDVVGCMIGLATLTGCDDHDQIV
jgi:hypothetical protein